MVEKLFFLLVPLFPLCFFNNGTEMANIREVHWACKGFPCVMPLSPESLLVYRWQFVDKESEVQEGFVVCPRELILQEVKCKC